MVSYSCVFHERPLKATLIGISEQLRDKHTEPGERREMVLETAACYESSRESAYLQVLYLQLPATGKFHSATVVTLLADGKKLLTPKWDPKLYYSQMCSFILVHLKSCFTSKICNLSHFLYANGFTPQMSWTVMFLAV